MAKGKRTKTTSKAKSKKMSQKAIEEMENRKLNIMVSVMILVSILLAVLIYAKQGYIGKTLSPALGGVLGFIKYIIPVGLFGMALYIAHDRDTKYSTSKLLMFFAVLICIDCFLACYQISNGAINPDKEMGKVLSRAYDLGTNDIGGGVIGTAIAAYLTRGIGTVGTMIASIGASLVMCVFIFSLHPAEAISNSLDKMEDARQRRAREKAEYDSRTQEVVEPRESWKDKRLREKEEKNKRKSEPLEEQITINLQDAPTYDHSKSGLDVPNFNGGKKAGLAGLKKAKDYKAINDNIEVKEPQEDSLFAKKEIEKEEKTQEVLQLEHASLTETEMNYEYPPIDLLNVVNNSDDRNSRQVLLNTAEKLRKTLYSFGVSAKVENVSVGPAITRYELAPAEGVRVSKIAKLSDDIALSLEAESIRIEAPIPGKHTVGIEVPNKSKAMVSLREIIESDAYQEADSKLTFALGKDVAGNAIVTDIAKMPHLLIAGSTGSGKSVCINTLIASIIYKSKPSEVKMLMVDPKIVELSIYNGIPHLLIPVVTDSKKAAGALAWAVQEMENRYSLFAQKNVRNIAGYNELAEKEGNYKLPHMVIIIDELADLMMVAAKDVEDAICRLAQKARAAGMHLVIATQRPSVDVITGIIKANIPSRIAFAVSSQIDSRTILDGAGAEKLLGKGDMLFYPAGAPKPTRIQGAFISDKEVENIVKFIRKDGDDIYDASIIEKIDKAGEPEKVDTAKDDDEDEVDPFLEDAIEMVVETQTASTSFIQRRFKVGYARAGRIIDQMEERGIISGYQGSKPREVLMTKDRWQELKMAPSSNNNMQQEVEDNEGEE